MKTINISGMNNKNKQNALLEAKVLKKLHSPYIVKYYDSYIEENSLAILMEYCGEGDLNKFLKAQMGRPLLEHRIWTFFIQLALGLEHLHFCKILHRDIKTMNILLSEGDSVRIGDLGVATVLTSADAFAHTIVGTPFYQSPELCEEKPYNVKSDVWALGCVLYELCALRHPFEAANQAALVMKIAKGKFFPINPGYSFELRQLVNVLLCKDYRRRPTVSEVLRRPVIREKAVLLHIEIPKESALYRPDSIEKPKITKESALYRPEKPMSFNNAICAFPARVEPPRRIRKPLTVNEIHREIDEVVNLPEIPCRGESSDEFEFVQEEIPVVFLENQAVPTLNAAVFERNPLNKDSATHDSESDEGWQEDEDTLDLNYDTTRVQLFQKLEELESSEAEITGKFHALKAGILQKLSQNLFFELYDFLKSIITSDKELTITDQDDLDRFVNCRIHSQDKNEIVLRMYNYLYIEAELERTQDSVRALRYELL